MKTTAEMLVELQDEVLILKQRLKTAELLLEDCSNFDTMATYDNGVGEFGANEGACMAVKHYDRVNTYLRNRPDSGIGDS